MNKKNIGYIIAALLIGSMVVIMVKSNINKAEPINVGKVTEDNSSASNEEFGLGEGDTPPDFELSTISGEVVKLSDLKGKKVVLNFWASWCGPCKSEMPHMQNYYRNNKDEDNVEIVAVNLTSSEKLGLKAVENFIDSYGLTFPVPLDKEGMVSETYQIYAVPTTFMIQTDGTIAQQITGPVDEKTLKDLVQDLD